MCLSINDIIIFLCIAARCRGGSQTPKIKIMEQLNKIELKGNVGFVRILNVEGKHVIKLSVATNYVYKGRTGEPVIETTWHNVSAWESKGMPDFTKIEKGTKIHVIGRLRNQRYTDSEGQERYSTEVSAYQMEIIEDRGILQYEFA